MSTSSGGFPGMGGTDERVETLKKLWLDGLSASQIAKQLGGVTRNAGIGKDHRPGLSGPGGPPPPARPAFKAPRPARPAATAVPMARRATPPQTREASPTTPRAPSPPPQPEERGVA